MGRCYEFGVSIDPSSEHAMVVTPEGGHCVCPSTGAVCHGRFAGCVDIVSQPGRVPPNAPAWARPDAAVTGAVRTTPSLSNTAAPTTPPPTAAPPQAGAPGTPLNPAAWTAPTPPPPATAPAHLTTPVAAPTYVVASPAPTPTPAPMPAPRHDTAASSVGELGELLGVVQRLKSELSTERSADSRLAEIERSVERLSHHVAPPAPPASAGLDELRSHVTGLSETMQRMATAHSDAVSAFSAQTAALHQTIENLAQMVVLARQETADGAERHHQELHAVRRQMIELRASIEERVEMSASDRLGDELRAVRTAVEELEAASPTDVITASQLAETINTLRDAGVEEISAAHLVHSFQLEIRSLREQLESVLPAASASATTAQYTEADSAAVSP